MAVMTYRTSRPDAWTLPRQPLDPSMRRHRHGPIRPMADDRGFLERLFSR